MFFPYPYPHARQKKDRCGWEADRSDVHNKKAVSLIVWKSYKNKI